MIFSLLNKTTIMRPTASFQIKRIANQNHIVSGYQINVFWGFFFIKVCTPQLLSPLMKLPLVTPVKICNYLPV